MFNNRETHTSSHPARATAGVNVRGALGNLQRVLKALDDRRKARELYTWSNEELKDIGISRGDVDREASKPIRLW